MEFLKSHAAQIGEQLRGMSNSARIAVVMSLVVALVGVWGLFSWAGTAQWVPVLDQPLSETESQRVRAALTGAGIESRQEGDRVVIKGETEQRRRAQAVLAQNDAMPRDTSLSYTSLLSNRSPFTGDSARRWAENRGLEFELSSVMRNFTGVRAAKVLLVKTKQRGFGSRQGASSASVHVTMDGSDGIPKALVSSIAEFVAGAAGIKVGDVKITDGLRFYRPPDAANGMTTDQLDLQREIEEHHTSKIYDQLRNIAGVIVNVHASLRQFDEQRSDKKLGPVQVLKERINEEETTGGGDAVGPGVRPNVGRALADATPSSKNTKEDRETDLGGDRDQNTRSEIHRQGEIETLRASVAVPRSYLAEIARSRLGKGPEDTITDKEIQPIATVELPRIEKMVLPLIQVNADGQLVVDWYYDGAPMAAGSAAAAAGATGGAAVPTDYVALAREFGPQVGLGLVAMFCVFSVMRMAKKAQATLASPSEPGGPAMEAEADIASFGGGPMAVGEAEEIGAILEGREVDEEVVRTQQIVKQIGSLVTADATAAAGLLQRWIAEDR